MIRNRWRLSLTRWSSSKYRSAVIAWSPEDRPTDAQIEAVLDEFDKTAWAGLDADRYSWTVVLHREQGGGSHAHVLTARCDPETGRSLNIAPPGREKALDRCATSRARLEPAGRLGAGEGAATRPSRLHRGRDTADRPEARNRPAGVDPGLPDAARRYGAVRNRADAVAALEDAGLEVPRKGKSYVTVRNPDDGCREHCTSITSNRCGLDLQAPAPARDRAGGDRGAARARQIGIWVSREAGEGADGAAVALTGDLAP